VIGPSGIVVALVLSTWAGWGVVGVLDRARPSSAADAVGRLALGFLVGVGTSSVLAFFTLLLGGSLGPGYAIFDAVALIALAAAATWLGLRRRARSGAVPPMSRTEVVAVLLVLAAIALAAVAFSKATIELPHGRWDARAIWNLRARFLFRAGTAWRDAFSPSLSQSHVEYPLLLPLSVARLWTYAGESTLAPAILAACFTLTGPLALGAAVARGAGTLAGAVAALLLLATSAFTLSGASQYADVPVAVFVMAGASLLSIETGEVDRRGLLALAGLLLGLGGWTKNEGLAAAACTVAAFAALGWRARGSRVFRDLALVALGAAIPAAAWIALHHALVPSLAVDFAQDGAGFWARVSSADRWTLVLTTLAATFPGHEHGLPIFALALAGALGARPRALSRSRPLLAAVLLSCLYAVLYVATPQDLEWLLRTSAERVQLQVWLLLLLGLFCATGPGVAGDVTTATATASDEGTAG
jgi:hypothetical protein